MSEVYWSVWCLYGNLFCRWVYLLCVSQLFKVDQRGALGLAGGVGLTEVHLILPLRRAQVEHSGCAGWTTITMLPLPSPQITVLYCSVQQFNLHRWKQNAIHWFEAEKSTDMKNYNWLKWIILQLKKVLVSDWLSVWLPCCIKNKNFDHKTVVCIKSWPLHNQYILINEHQVRTISGCWQAVILTSSVFNEP